jgi:carboxypeptidase C (cathepsin A)
VAIVSGHPAGIRPQTRDNVASRRIEIEIRKRLSDDPETRGQLPVAAQTGHHKAVTDSGVVRPGAIAWALLLPSL